MELKDRIKQKANELYRRYGVKSVTMDEIATQMGVSKKTIYQCFSDKNELVDEVVAGMLQFNKTCCRNSVVKAENAIHEVFLAMDNQQQIMENMNPSILYDIKRGHPNTFKRFADFKHHFLFDIIKKNIEWGKKEELYRNEINIEIIAKVRLETMMLPFNEELFSRREYSLVNLQKELLEFFLFGLATSKGHKLITKYQKERLKKNVQ